MLKLALIGKDVSKSISPFIHRFLLQKFGRDCRYDTFSVSSQEFPSACLRLFEEYDALNVTIPYKTEIGRFLLDLKGQAAACGSVNTVLTKSRLGFNTDGSGFLLSLEGENVSVRGKNVLVLGAGGAGRCCAQALAENGANVYVYEREKERLKRFAKEWKGFFPLPAVPLLPFFLIVNCTGIGMHETEGQLPSLRFIEDASFERLSELWQKEEDLWQESGEGPQFVKLLSLCSVAVDLIYVPRQSAFLKLAAELGKKTIHGEAMLFYQAYFTDCILLDRKPDREEAMELYQIFKGDPL